jgi:hypothetical protein
MPAGVPRRRPPQERHAFGLTILHPSHPEVQRLQHEAALPSLHGHKVWPTSFVLLDYLHQRGVAPQARVLGLMRANGSVNGVNKGTYEGGWLANYHRGLQAIGDVHDQRA